jgi:hypothetical protein
MYKLLKRTLLPSLRSKLKQAVSSHKHDHREFHRDIVCDIFGAKPDITLSVHIRSDHWNTLNINTKIWSVKCDTLEEGFNRCTSEVANAQDSYPYYAFYRCFSVLKEDVITYLQKNGKLPISEIKDMTIRLHEQWPASAFLVYHKYLSGSWRISYAGPYRRWRETDRPFDESTIPGYKSEIHAYDTIYQRQGIADCGWPKDVDMEDFCP